MKNKYIYGIGIVLTFLVVSMPFCLAQEMSLTYDANGNLITGDGKYRVYNSLNQLWRIYNGSNTSILLEEYTYHPVEERVFIKEVYNNTGAIIETTFYINQNYVQVINASGTFNFTYYYVQGQLVAQDLNGIKTFFATDQKNNIVAVMNSSGSVVDNITYGPYGEVLSGGNTSRYQYEGKEYDSRVGDTDYNARKFKQDWGIFGQPDTIIQNVYDSQSLNRYSFERNSPYNKIDPTGHVFWAVNFVNKAKELFNKALDSIDASIKQASNNVKKAFTPKNPVEHVAKGVYDITAGPYVDLASYGAEEYYYQSTKNAGSDSRKQSIQSNIESRRVDATYDSVSIGLDLVSGGTSSATKTTMSTTTSLLKGIKYGSDAYTLATHGDIIRDTIENNIKSPWIIEYMDFRGTGQQNNGACTAFSNTADMTKPYANGKNDK